MLVGFSPSTSLLAVGTPFPTPGFFGPTGRRRWPVEDRPRRVVVEAVTPPSSGVTFLSGVSFDASRSMTRIVSSFFGGPGVRPIPGAVGLGPTVDRSSGVAGVPGVRLGVWTWDDEGRSRVRARARELRCAGVLSTPPRSST
jgi:hypothetical protein